ncbi:MAG: retroviral-like aspartic protease family protein [Treponema sp.]|jgi:clan AA aspartic protease|nr:retroviral-like aspartic protease family protein [Treponema sp.]
MGTIYTDIILKNAGDVTIAQRGIIPEQQIRAAAVTAMVDTGTGTLVINEETRQRLGLAIEGLRQATLADGTSTIYQMTEPVRIQWEDRFTSCHALVVSDADSILLGVIPLEDMDLIVDPKMQVLTGAHGRQALYMLKGFQ